MKKITLLVSGSILSLGLFLVTSCEKEEVKKDIDTQAASDNEQAEAVSDDAMRKADAATKGQSSFKVGGVEDLTLACATVTRDTAGNQTTVTIDFGTANCLSADGRNRRGKIIQTFNGNYFAAGSVRTITFNNYYVDDHKVEGDHTVTFNGMDSVSGHYTWNISANNMKITRPDGKFHTWTSSRKREMIAGDTTLLNFTDDVYQITGSANGTNINNVTYTANIDNALRVESACRWITSGKLTLKVSGLADRSIDFGGGNCDQTAVVTIAGIPYTIQLH